MRKQGDTAASNPEAARIIPRLAPGGLYCPAHKSPHAQAGGYCGLHPEAARIIPRVAVGLAPDIPRLAPGGFLSLVQ